jgi:ATP-dependent DNA helicase RecG
MNVKIEDKAVRYLKGIGPKREAGLRRLGIHTLIDLLYYFPIRYQDRRTIAKISQIREDDYFLIQGKVMARKLWSARSSSFLKRTVIFEVVLSDGTGLVNCVWFNQPYLKDYIKVADTLLLWGKPTRFRGRLQFNSPEYEKTSDKEASSLNFGRIVGFYRLTEGFNQARMRRMIFQALEDYATKIRDLLPYYIRETRNLPNITQSLKSIHFPSSLEEARLARQRFIFEELFFSQIMVYLRKAKRVSKRGIAFDIDSFWLKDFKDNLPFRLTPSQELVVNQILEDMAKPHPMHRLLQGDVGSGKTVVAMFAIGLCVNSGYQAALMVPTEVLAYQHYQTLSQAFSKFNYKIALLVSSISKKERERILLQLEKGKIDILVGTHALIQEDVKFGQLGLVVIDEQHKFGVAQRALLPKKGLAPDCLVMSATPIPRSLALSLYGDLDLSVLDQLPPGRKEPKTIIVKEEKRRWVYKFIKDKLSEGRQAYIIYPVIEETQDQDLYSLLQMYTKLESIFAGFGVGVFHGRLNSAQKRKVVEDFTRGKIGVLISTTVVEVGINIENAVVMVVENPERFGLAQLHQLRGRIRRSKYLPYFILIVKEGLAPAAQKRIEVIGATSDGFKIAEEDLRIRGPGDFFGHLQWGFPELKIADPLKDYEILNQARRFAYQVIKKDPQLTQSHHKSIRDYLKLYFQR